MKRTLLVAATSLALVALAACGSSGEPASAGGNGAVATDKVEAVKSYRFAPANITVATGTTVTWTNNDNFVHDVHLLGTNDVTKPLAVGKSTSITFNEPGLVRYQCSLHPSQMNGSVLVT